MHFLKWALKTLGRTVIMYALLPITIFIWLLASLILACIDEYEDYCSREEKKK